MIIHHHELSGLKLIYSEILLHPSPTKMATVTGRYFGIKIQEPGSQQIQLK
jgi:hypothetical protein